MQDSQFAAQKQRAFSRRLKLRKAEQIVLLSLIPLGFIVAVVGGYFWWLDHRERDIANAPLQTGTAVVATMTQVSGKRGYIVNLTFRIKGRIAGLSIIPGDNAAEDEHLIWTKAGDTVSVTYHVGQSGTVYIEDWQAPPHKISLSR